LWLYTCISSQGTQVISVVIMSLIYNCLDIPIQQNIITVRKVVCLILWGILLGSVCGFIILFLNYFLKPGNT